MIGGTLILVGLISPLAALTGTKTTTKPSELVDHRPQAWATHRSTGGGRMAEAGSGYIFKMLLEVKKRKGKGKIPCKQTASAANNVLVF